MVLNNLTLDIPNKFLFAISKYIHMYYMILHLNCILKFSKNANK